MFSHSDMTDTLRTFLIPRLNHTSVVIVLRGPINANVSSMCVCALPSVPSVPMWIPHEIAFNCGIDMLR
jgi:hypothetical protein